MLPKQTLASLVALINPTATDEQIRAAVDTAITRCEKIYGPSRGGTSRVSDAALRERLLTFIRESPHLPAVREILAKVPGNRARLHEMLKQLTSEGIVEIVKGGRTRGLKVK